MKKTFLAAILICGGTAYNAYSAETDTLTIRDCVTGAYYPEYVYGVTPMADGETYSQLSDDATRIIRKSFKDASEVGTVFDCSAVPGCPVRRIGGYSMSPDEKTILLETQHKSIYRHSYTAVYYVCNLETKEIRPLSQGGPQQQPHFSPDGKKVAFVREGNLFIVADHYRREVQRSHQRPARLGKRGRIYHSLLVRLQCRLEKPRLGALR